MKKKLIAGLLLANFITMNTTPALAFIRLGVQKQDADTKTQKVKVEKQQKTKWTKLKITNKYDFVNLPWWEAFNDDYLNGYIQQAVEHNYNLQAASLSVDEYYQSVKAQMSNELPTVGAGVMPGYGGTEHDSNASMFIPIVVSYEADIFLKNHDKTKSAKKTYEASIQDERAAYISVVSAVGTTYFNIVQLDKLIETQKHINSLRKEIYDAMVVSNREGVTSTSDVVKANKALVMGESVLLDYEKNRIQALNRLAVLIGESPANSSSLKRAKYESIEYKFNAPNEIPSEIITQRPDYLKSEIMLQKSGIDVRVAKKEFLPSINIGGMGLFNVIHSSGMPLSNFIWGFGGSAFESLFTGGAKMANLRMNKVKYERMLKTYQNTNLISIQEVNDALYAYKYDNDKYNRNVKNQNLEAKDFSLSEKMYEQGVMSKLDLNQKHENLLTIDNLVVQSKIGCIVDSIGLYKATGAGVNKTLKLN